MLSLRKRKSVLQALSLATPPAGTTSWRTAKSLITLRDQANAAFPDRSKASDGTIGDGDHQSRESDHNPWVKDGSQGVVTALDLTHDPAHGCDAQRIVDALVASRDPRIKYVIWNKRILSASVRPWVWRVYGGGNPHTLHFHLSVSSNKALYDRGSPWALDPG